MKLEVYKRTISILNIKNVYKKLFLNLIFVYINFPNISNKIYNLREE